MTRNRPKLNVPLLDLKGWKGKLVKSEITRGWNLLLVNLKQEVNILKFKLGLKKFIFSFYSS